MAKAYRVTGRSSDDPTPEDIQGTVATLLEELCFSSSDWFMFPHVYLKFLTPVQAMTFAYLCSEQRKYTKAGQTCNGWFYCKVEKMEDELSLKRNCQTNALRKLRDLKLIHHSRHGRLGFRYFWINRMGLCKLVLKAKDKKVPTWLKDSEPPKFEWNRDYKHEQTYN